MDLLILILTCAANLLLGSIVLLRDPKSGLARSFGLMCLFIDLWIATNYMTNHPIQGDIALNDLANRAAYVSGYLVMFSGLVFTQFFPVKRVVRKSRAIWELAVFSVVLIISATDLVAGHVLLAPDGTVSYTVGPLLWLYIVGFLFLLVRIAKNLVSFSSAVDVNRKRQARFVLVAFCVSAILAILLNAIIPLIVSEWHTTRFGPLATVVLVAIIAYTIVRHRLFDIKLAVVRTIAYACVLLTLSAVYYLFAYLLSVLAFGGNVSNSISISPVNIFLALLLAFLFQPIKKFFDRTTNNIFYRESYKSEEFFADLSQLLVSTTELRGLLERASNEMADTFKAEQVFFFLYYTNATHHHISAGTKPHSRLPVYDAHMLDAYVAKQPGDIILTEKMPESYDIRRMLVSHKIALVMPLRQANGVVGYVCFGDQRGSGYTKRDLKVLATVADELVIAIQNALSLHEIKEINATLQQRIDNATQELRSSNAQLRHLDEVKDEFMSMASHQLRTPLTSVKGYLSMVIEGDTGDISAQQRRVLEEAFNSSERMVRLIADFLNVSRLQTGKFVVEKSPSDIVKVVKDEVSSLKIIAKTHDMKLIFKMPNEPLPKVTVDEAKIRQVIMNFVDNAIYYSRPNTTVKVVLERVDNDLAFKVIDTGIGVPADEQSKLFNKFFRAKNARKQRPDGTGVGLYLAKKVITAHKGKMIFASEEGKGSTFGFRIPLDQVRE